MSNFDRSWEMTPNIPSAFATIATVAVVSVVPANRTPTPARPPGRLGVPILSHRRASSTIPITVTLRCAPIADAVVVGGYANPSIAGGHVLRLPGWIRREGGGVRSCIIIFGGWAHSEGGKELDVFEGDGHV
jgi:hypothetical protein